MKKIACITGASAGIGSACARILAREGYNLILCARRSDRVQQLAVELRAAHQTECLVLTLDVRQAEEVRRAFSDLAENWRSIDVLINNAGLSRGLDPIQSGHIDDWEQMIDTNIKGLLYVTRAVSPGMTDRKSGHIINIGSIAAKEVYPNGNVYCATKHAVDALNKGMRVDLLPYGIKVTAIHPGMVETEFSEVRFHGDQARAKLVYENLEPLVAEDIAETVSFVLSRPAHVNINDLVIMPTAQASGTIVHRRTTT